MPVRMKVEVEPGSVDPTQFPYDLVVRVADDGVPPPAADSDVALTVATANLETRSPTSPQYDSRKSLVSGDPSQTPGYLEFTWNDVLLDQSNEIRVPVRTLLAPLDVPVSLRAESLTAIPDAPAGTLYGDLQTVTVPAMSSCGSP
ncbi:MAG: hypothetical protein ACF8XB_05715 [Planctomycetota bacterium JB042]